MTTSARSTGRTIGVLLLVHLFGAILLNAVILAPVFRAPGYLENAAAMPWRISAAIVLNLALALLTLAIAIRARPLFRATSEPLALTYLLLVAVGLALTAGENVGLYTMQKVSEAHASQLSAASESAASDSTASVSAASDSAATAIAATAIATSGVRLVAASVRNGAHYTNVFLAGAAILLFYTILFRGRLVPRLLATAGILAALLQMTAVAMPFFGRPVDSRLLAPLGVVHILLAIWLLARGFDDSAQRPSD